MLQAIIHPSEMDGEVLALWRAKNLYDWQPNLSRPLFSLLITPPNPTGDLHLGHALNEGLEDILARWHRLKGCEILWSAGIDHGGFSTQTVVEQYLKNNCSTDKMSLTETLSREVDLWTGRIAERIRSQMIDLGIMADMYPFFVITDKFNDDYISQYVGRLYEKGLIVREWGIVDWCFQCKTTLEGIDQARRQLRTAQHSFRYRECRRNGMDVDNTAEIIVSVERPEQIYGQVAVVIGCGDSSLEQYVGRWFQGPVGEPVVAVAAEGDWGIKPGEAAMCVPAHSRRHYKCAVKHSLEVKTSYGEDGTIQRGPMKGTDCAIARQAVISQARAAGLYVGETEKIVIRPICKNCKTEVEEYYSLQWFFRAHKLYKRALELLKHYGTDVTPNMYHSQLELWLQARIAETETSTDSLSDSDWCVSRQIACGNRLPMYRCSNGHDYVGKAPEHCSYCDGIMWRSQERLDMRLTAVLWAFCSNRKYTDIQDIFEYVSRHAYCVVGADNLIWWVAGIFLSSAGLEEPLPVSRFHINPLICDAQGRKMSKSLGNVVDPREAVEEFGIDCLRMTLLETMRTSSKKMFFREDRLLENRRIIDQFLDNCRILSEMSATALGKDICWTETAACLNEKIIRCDFGEIYPIVRSVCKQVNTVATQKGVRDPARFLTESLVLLHPFLPITTEWLWQQVNCTDPPLATLCGHGVLSTLQ